ncbi:HupE-UreJ family metal transporter [Rubellimicrobium mesophilum DSM 19309]|uniref:HupE-UreJ family metal transporter n=1 Tax=Rubellimicrobium mesophilum DSM 19309 TaxID=442562 RepID=A0A017HCR4_9RHOB|nr:HupE/UreJ family protein [Rubellimicrobium mesophilum]EYD71549.1 HupE-UreJ family metal transporter [Rubellimicrobium mesophilum DSM 19309]
MFRTLPLALLLALAATPALAHLDPAEHGSFMAGLSHPLLGLDHVLAMVGVGLWGAVLGGRARWALPSCFVASMIGGFGLALMGVALPLVEPMVLGSVLALGLAVGLMVRVPLGIAGVLAGLFGMMHGHAHGGELGSAGALAFGLGFVASTAVLHAVGLFVAWGYSMGMRRHGALVRGMGWATALGGVWIAMGR